MWLPSRPNFIAGFRLFLGAIGIVVLVVLAFYTPTTVCAEDAIILHQYSRNFAETGVISYIPGGPPAEGATDFLWMAYLAAALKLHIAPGLGSAIANVAACVGLATVFLRIAEARVTIVSVLSTIGGIALFPQMQAALQGFGVLPFGFFLCLMLYAAFRENDVATALYALTLCLTRPDGVVFAIPAILLLRIPCASSKRKSILTFSALFFLPGIAYFLWRWHYFKQLFPLPFVVKASEPRTLGLFVFSSVLALLPYLVFAGIVIAGVLGKKAIEWANARLLLVCFVIPAIFYANLRLEQNLFDRFFFFIPVSAGILIARHWRETWTFESNRLLASLGMACCLFFAFLAVRGFFGNLSRRHAWDDLRSLATEIGQPALRGTMLTTEAGLIPYYSRWTPYDAWGLDTPEFARKLIQPEQVTGLHPDLAIVHDGSQSCTLQVHPRQTSRDWINMTDNIETGLTNLGAYDAWKVPYIAGRQGTNPRALKKLAADHLCFYVAQGYAGHDQFERILQKHGAVRVSAP